MKHKMLKSSTISKEDLYKGNYHKSKNEYVVVNVTQKQLDEFYQPLIEYHVENIIQMITEMKTEKL